MIVAGVDEAGVGPVLGPLVCSATAFSVPDELAETSMWKLMSGAICRSPSRKGKKVAIGDSKKLYNRHGKTPLIHLERAILGMLATAGRKPKCFTEVLSIVAPNTREHLPQYPWYDGKDLELPQCLGQSEAVFTGNALSVEMQRVGIQLETIRCEPILVGEFNRLVNAARNKSTALFDVTCRLISYLWNRYDQPVQIHIDRQGGRKRHVQKLQRIFDGCSLKVLDESDTYSGYRIACGSRVAEIHFSVGAEEKQLPVALASMFSKYVREMCMELFNGYWRALRPELKPTAGYFTDGRRFYKEIEPLVRQRQIPEHIIYRVR